jgi:hypothetical protein
MRAVTRDIDPAGASDLLERVPRACLAFTGADGPEVTPVVLECPEGRYLAGLAPGNGPLPTPGQEAVVLVDEGVQWFQLRAVSVRGVLRSADSPALAPSGHSWFEIVPSRVGAWDYGQLREAGDEA